MKRAIITGLNYVGSPYALPDCDIDANNIAGLAGEAGYKVTKSTGIFSVSDFVSEIVAIRENARKSDTTLIYQSGHGTNWHSPGSDERDRVEEGICFWSGTEIEVLPDNDFRALVQEIRGTVIVMFDTCFSGGMDRDAATPGMRRKFIPFDNFKIKTARPFISKGAIPLNKMYFLFASGEDEASWSTGAGGLFTRAFCAGYQNILIPRTIKSLMSYAKDVCMRDQTPNWKIIGGNATKRLF